MPLKNFWLSKASQIGLLKALSERFFSTFSLHCSEVGQAGVNPVVRNTEEMVVTKPNKALTTTMKLTTKHICHKQMKVPLFSWIVLICG